MKHKISKLSGDNIIIILFAILVVVALINVAVLTGISLSIGQKAAMQKAVAEPAKIDIVEISTNCSNCSTDDNTITSIKNQNVNASQRNIDLSSPEAASLISRYRISKLPALIITGEINKTSSLSNFWSQLGKTSSDAVIVEAQLPYYSVNESRIVGLVTLRRLVDSSCTKCASLDGFVSAFKRSGVVVISDSFFLYGFFVGLGRKHKRANHAAARQSKNQSNQQLFHNSVSLCLCNDKQ